MSRRRWDEKNHQVTWEDVEPWIQQLYDEHGVIVTVKVHLEGLCSGLLPAVRVIASKAGLGAELTEVHSDYRTFSLRSIGEVEKLSLHMLSNLLLSLDNDKWRAEREVLSLFAQ